MKIKPIIIQTSKTADSRTADNPREVTKEQLLNSTVQHIEDVQKGLTEIAGLILKASEMHDHTKIEYFDKFYDNFISSFKRTDWYDLHLEQERHHLKADNIVQEDVNLIDVLEMLVDGIMAGKGRKGSYETQLGEEDYIKNLLFKAFKNTEKMLDEGVIVVKDNE